MLLAHYVPLIKIQKLRSTPNQQISHAYKKTFLLCQLATGYKRICIMSNSFLALFFKPALFGVILT